MKNMDNKKGKTTSMFVYLSTRHNLLKWTVDTNQLLASFGMCSFLSLFHLFIHKF